MGDNTHIYGDELPRYIKADVYKYEFTKINEYLDGGNYWKRKRTQEYIAP